MFMHLPKHHPNHRFCPSVATVYKTNEIINILMFPRVHGWQSLVRRWRFEVYFISKTSKLQTNMLGCYFFILETVFKIVSIKSLSGSTIFCKKHYKTWAIFEAQITRVAVTMVNVTYSDFMKMHKIANMLISFTRDTFPHAQITPDPQIILWRLSRAFFCRICLWALLECARNP